MRRELLDETFDPHQTQRYELFVRAGLEGYEVAVLERERKRFVGFLEFPVAIVTPDDWVLATRDLFASYPWLTGQWRRATLAVRSERYTLVPKEYYDPAQAKLLMERLVGLSGYEEVHVEYPQEGVAFLHAVPSSLVGSWLHQHPKLEVFHHDASLLRVTRSAHRRGYLLTLHANDDFVTLTLLEGDELLSMIPMRVLEPPDALYRVLGVLDSQGILPLEVRYHLYGSGVRGPRAANVPEQRVLSVAAIDGALSSYMLRAGLRPALSGYAFSYLLERLQGPYQSLFALASCV